MAAQKVSTDTVVRAVREDITQVDADAFVYHAQGDLVLGTGFGNAIAQRGGPSIQAELNELLGSESDLHLGLIAADRNDLRDARDPQQRTPNIPVGGGAEIARRDRIVA